MNKNVKIILKLDDFTYVTKRVIKLDKLIKKENIKVTWGIIGNDFNKISHKDLKWCKKSLETGLYYYWNHGLTHDFNEFKNLSFEEQINHITTTQDIVKEKLEFGMESFGAPCNAFNQYTIKVLESIGEIKYWYYGNESFSRVTLKRDIELEQPLFRPNYNYFRQEYEKFKGNILILQAHPNQWKFWDFYNFKKIVRFLKENECSFIFPNEIDALP